MVLQLIVTAPKDQSHLIRNSYAFIPGTGGNVTCYRLMDTILLKYEDGGLNVGGERRR